MLLFVFLFDFFTSLFSILASISPLFLTRPPFLDQVSKGNKKREDKMKSLGLLATVCATAALAKGPERVSNAARSITIEVAPGETHQITEDERWDIATVSLWWC